MVVCFSNWLSMIGGILLRSVHPFPWCEFSCRGLFQLAYEMSDNFTNIPLDLGISAICSEISSEKTALGSETKRK